MTRKRALWISLAAFAAALAVGWALVIALERQRAERRQADQLQWVYTNAHALQDNVNRALSTTHTLSALVRQFKGVPNFDGLAADLMANVPSLSGLMLAPAGTLSHAYPPDGPIPLGHNLFDGGPWRQTATRAAEAGQLALDGPTHLPGGSLGLLGALPVSLPDDTGRPQFWGLVLAVVELDATVAGTRLGSLVEGGFRYTLWREVDDPDNPQWLGGAPQPAADAPLRATVEVARQRWTLGVWPPADAPLEAEVVVEAALVVLIAGALAHLVFVLLRQPVLLQREVARKTHELHEATARRRQVEAERNRFFTLSLDLFCIAGFDGHFKQLNPVWEKTLGYPLDELKARPWVEFVHPDDREATEAEGARLMAGEETGAFENRYRCKDGGYRWLLWSASADLDNARIFAGARDVTAAKHTQRALVEQERRMRSLFGVAAEAGLSIEQLLRATLATASQLLGLERGAIRRIEGAHYTVIEGHPAGAQAAPGRRRPLDRTWCALTHQRREVVAVEDTAAAPPPDGGARPVEAAYIGVPLLLEGEPVGTLSFAGAAPRGAPFLPADKDFVRTVGRWVSTMLERLQAERKLQQSEARFRALADLSPMGIFQTDAAGRCTYVNRRWCELSGVAAQHALGDGWRRAVHPDDQDAVAGTWLETTRRQQDFHMELRFLTPAAQTVWVDVHATAVRSSDDDQVTGYIGTVSDITEAKRNARRLQRQIRRQGALAEIGLAINQTFELQAVLDRIVEITSTLLPATIGCSLLIWDEAAQRFVTGASSVPGPTGHHGHVARVRREGGATRWIVDRGQPLLVPDVADDPFGANPMLAEVGCRAYLGVPLKNGPRVMGVLYAMDNHTKAYAEDDVSFMQELAGRASVAINRVRLYEQLREANASLAKSESRYRDLFENANDGIYTLDRRGRFTSFNRQAERLTGLSQAEVLGKPYALVVRPADLAKARKKFVKNLRGQTQTFELQLRHAAGTEIVVELSTRPIVQGDAVVGIQGIARDVTERRALEKMKDEFVATVSHELRTPLTSIKGYTELLSQGAEDNLTAQQAEFVHILMRNTRRLAQLIDDVLEVAKLDAGQVTVSRQPVELAPALEEVAQTFQLKAREKGLDLRLELDAALRVRGGHNRLVQVFSNLVSNAIKYTASGSVSLRACAQGAHAVVEVRDTGIGIAADELPFLFQKFFRASNAVRRQIGGTGLGLAITHALVARLQGRIEVESALDRGTLFRVVLPLEATPLGPAIMQETTSAREGKGADEDPDR